MEQVQAKTPTIVGIIKNNDEIISECIDYSSRISGVLTEGNIPEINQTTPSCVMENLINQDEQLSILRDMLKKIYSNVIEGGN